MATGTGFSPVVGRGKALGVGPRPFIGTSASVEEDENESRPSTGHLLSQSLRTPLAAAWKSTSDMRMEFRAGDSVAVAQAALKLHNRPGLSSSATAPLLPTKRGTAAGIVGHVLVRGDTQRGRHKAADMDYQVDDLDVSDIVPDLKTSPKAAPTKTGGQFGAVSSFGGVVKQMAKVTPHRWIQTTKAKLARETFKAAARRVAKAARMKAMGGIAQMGRGLGGKDTGGLFGLANNLIMEKTKRKLLAVQKKTQAARKAGVLSEDAEHGTTRPRPTFSLAGGRRAAAMKPKSIDTSAPVALPTQQRSGARSPAPQFDFSNRDGMDVFLSKSTPSSRPTSTTVRRRSVRRASISKHLQRRPTISGLLHTPAESMFVNEPWSPILARWVWLFTGTLSSPCLLTMFAQVPIYSARATDC